MAPHTNNFLFYFKDKKEHSTGCHSIKNTFFPQNWGKSMVFVTLFLWWWWSDDVIVLERLEPENFSNPTLKGHFSTLVNLAPGGLRPWLILSLHSVYLMYDSDKVCTPILITVQSGNIAHLR